MKKREKKVFLLISFSSRYYKVKQKDVEKRRKESAVTYIRKPNDDEIDINIDIDIDIDIER